MMALIPLVMGRVMELGRDSVLQAVTEKGNI